MGLLWLYLPFLCKSQGIWGGGLDTYTRGIKDFHKCWMGSLAKRRLCLGPAGVINCTPLSALSFWVSLFPGKRGYNSITNIYYILFYSWSNWLKVTQIVMGTTQEMQVWSLGQEDPLEKEMAPTSVFLPGESHGQSVIAMLSGKQTHSEGQCR